MQQDTIAANTVAGGGAGTGGPGGKGGSYGKGNGSNGQAGQAGDGSAGALYVKGGAVSFYNSTVALNTQTGGGSVGGVLQIGGTVNAVSTLFAGDGTVDYSGAVDATDSLIQAAPDTDTINGSGNLIGVDPKLATAGLASNGGPTQTIALQAGSPALGKGTNPESFFTDQRGYGPRTGSGGTDIGAVQHDAVADTTAPTAALTATGVTSTSAPNPYQFEVTYTDNLAIAATTLAGAVVSVTPPGGKPITATVVSTAAVGSTDPFGDAKSFVVTYEITPPGGAWSASDNGTYTVSLGGAPVTDLAGNPATTGSLGTFAVDISTAVHMVISGPTPTTVTAGSNFSITVTMENSQGTVQTGYTGSITIALAANPGGAGIGGTSTVDVSDGVATFSPLTLNQAANGYSIEATSTGLSSVTTNPFDVVPAAASKLAITTEPPQSVTAGQKFSMAVTVEDKYGNTETGYVGSVTVALSSNPGNATLGGKLTVAVSDGVATFSPLTVNNVADGYQIQATDTTGLAKATSSTFDVTGPAGGQTSNNAPTQIAITAEPTSSSPVTAGSGFTVTVALENSQGQVQTGTSGMVTIALASGPSGVGLGGTLSVAVSQGVATFTDLTLDQADDGYTLELTFPDLPAVTTSAFEVTPAAATQVVITTLPPSGVTAGQGFGLAATVEDQYDNVETGYSGDVTVALSAGPGGVGLGGTLSVAASQGVATFTDLTLDQAAADYSLSVATTGLPAVTTAGPGVTPAAPSQLVVTAPPPSSLTAGQSFGLAVTVEDSFGNVETGYSGAVTLALAANPGGATLGGTLTETATQGVATFANLTLNQAADGYTLQVTSGTLPAVTTAAINVGAAAGTNPPPSGGGGGTGSPTGRGQNTGTPTSTPSSGSGASTTGNGTSGSGTTSTGDSGDNGSTKAHSGKRHHPHKKAVSSKGHTHKRPSHLLGHHAHSKSHHAKTAIPVMLPDIRSHMLLRRKLS